MIRLNFIPEQQRKPRAKLVGETFGGIPSEIVVGSGVALLSFFLAIHLLLGVAAFYKMAAYKIMESRWNGMAGDKKAYDVIADEFKAIQAKMNSVRSVTSLQQLQWAHLMNEISDSVPRGVWLRRMVFEKGELTIYGSSVSKTKNEMVETGNFVTALKDKKSIRDNFLSLDVDSIQMREDAAVAVADFSLKAKRK